MGRFRVLHHLLLLMLVVGFTSPPKTVRAAAIVYVVAGGAGTQTGDSWANAKDLQTALKNAIAGDEIWVKAGTYKPTTPTGYWYQGVAFELKSNIAVYGGFAGTETQRSQRDYRVNSTILSGDILGNDSGAIYTSNSTRSDNSRNVVRATNVTNVTLDGFVITGGNANGNDLFGGGFYSKQSTLVTLHHLTFWANASQYGGGLALRDQSDGTITSSAFLGNTAAYSGGGMYVESSTVALDQSVLSGNQILQYSNSSRGGVGVYLKQSTLSSANTTWANNTILTYGYNSRFGGALMSEQSVVTLTNSILWYNGYTPIYYPSGSLTIDHAIVEGGFTGNFILNSDPLFVNPLGNDGIAGTLDDDLRLSPNSPAINAGLNTLLPLDTNDENNNGDVSETIPLDFAGNPRINQEVVDLGAFEVINQCAAVNRLYVKHEAMGLNNGSSWTNAYTSLNDALTAVAGCSQPVEIWVAKGIYTPATTTDTPDATFRIPNGVAVYGGFVGTETDLNQRDFHTNKTILSGDILGNDVYEMQSSAAWSSISDNVKHVVTIGGVVRRAQLDGFTIRGGSIMASSGGGLYVYNAQASIQNTDFEWNYARSGGAIAVTDSQVSFTAINAHYNQALNGGVLRLEDSHVVVQHSSFITNAAILSGNGGTFSGVGGAISSLSSNITITHSILNANAAGNGGAVSLTEGSLTLDHSVMNGNTASSDGGAIYNSLSNVMLSHVVASGNVAEKRGGVIANNSDHMRISHSSISGNYAPIGSIMFTNTTLQPAIIHNSIMWGNIGSTEPFTGTVQLVYPEIQSSLIQGNDTNNSNLNSDPQFVDPDGADDSIGTLDDDVRLQTTSPAINMGNPSLIPTDTLDLDNDLEVNEPVPFDLDFKPRQVGIVDMGAYEYQINTWQLYLPTLIR